MSKVLGRVSGQEKGILNAEDCPKCPIYRLPKGGKSYQSWESGAVKGGR